MQMHSARNTLRVHVYEDYAATALRADLSGQWDSLQISTGLHGGFKECRLRVAMALPDAWMWLNREGAAGMHYAHISVQDGAGTVWEGRVMDVGLRIEPRFVGLNILGMGYYSSLRDRSYSASDAGMTDWTVGSHNTGEIIRELITQRCPDINGTADVALTPDGIGGISLTTRAYPMDIIIDKLAPLAGTGADTYYFSVWESRKPKWTSRATGTVHWLTMLAELEIGDLTQAGIHLRNYVLPVIGTAEGTGTISADSTALYPRREIVLNLQSGVPNAAANNARDAFLAERKDPMQSESFEIKGRVWHTQVGTMAAGNALVEEPKWRVRAGDVLRINDLVPASVATGTMDRLRTFYLTETRYDAGRDLLTVQPDRPPARLSVLLPRIAQQERTK